VQGEAEVLELARRGARHVRPDLVVVVGLLAEGGDVDHTDAGAHGPGAQLGQLLAPRGQHGQALLEEPGMRLAVGVDEVGADEARDGGAERDAQHRRGVGGEAGREVDVEHDHAALRGLSGHGARR